MTLENYNFIVNKVLQSFIYILFVFHITPTELHNHSRLHGWQSLKYLLFGPF